MEHTEELKRIAERNRELRKKMSDYRLKIKDMKDYEFVLKKMEEEVSHNSEKKKKIKNWVTYINE